MSSSTLTSKGQITVPKAVREALALHTGDRIRFVIHDDKTVTVEAETVDLRTLRGSLKSNGIHLTIEQMDEVIAQAVIESVIGKC